MDNYPPAGIKSTGKQFCPGKQLRLGCVGFEASSDAHWGYQVRSKEDENSPPFFKETWDGATWAAIASEPHRCTDLHLPNGYGPSGASTAVASNSSPRVPGASTSMQKRKLRILNTLLPHPRRKWRITPCTPRTASPGTTKGGGSTTAWPPASFVAGKSNGQRGLTVKLSQSLRDQGGEDLGDEWRALLANLKAVQFTHFISEQLLSSCYVPSAAVGMKDTKLLQFTP